MKFYLAFLLCIASQAALITQALPQGDLKANGVEPLAVSIQKIVTSGVTTLQITARNNSHSRLTLDKAALESPGFLVTTRIDSSGNIYQLCFGNMLGYPEGSDANAISHDAKRAVSIPPGGELKIQLDPGKLYNHLPSELHGDAMPICLTFHNLVVAVDNGPPGSGISLTVLSNTVDMPFEKR